MGEHVQKYILMNDRVGKHVEKGWLSSKDVPTQLLRGEIFVALPESEQPEDPEKMTLAVVPSNKTTHPSINLECPTLDVNKITNSEADLLLAIVSLEERFRTYRERNRLPAGKTLIVGDKVLVKLKDSHKEHRGVIWYKGTLPTNTGTMFGVELLEKDSEGQGTCDGTFRNKRYFDCPQDMGVFVALDKLRPLQEPIKSPKKETNFLSTIKDKMPSFSSRDSSVSAVTKMVKEHKLKIDQKVIVFPDNDSKIKDSELRGTVRYISDKIDSDGDCPVGIELDERKGSGTGIFRGKQRFVCKKDFALFVPVTSVFPAEDYDETSANNHSVAERLARSDGFTRLSLGYHEAENGAIRRSNPATYNLSQSAKEADLIFGGGKEQEKVCRQQNEMLKNIKAEQGLKTDNQTDGVDEPGKVKKDEALSFHEGHFEKHPIAKSEHTAGNSKFYNSREGETAACPHQDETPQGSMGLQTKNIVPESKNCNVHASGSGARETRISVPYNASSTESNPTTNHFYEKLSVASTSGLDQYKNTGLVQIDIEMRDNQLSAASFQEEDGNKFIDSGLEVGSMVEVPIMENKGRGTQYGVIRWIGQLPELAGKTVAGLELETEQPACSDGMFGGKRYFTCPAGRAFFVNLQHCHRDSRFNVESPGAAAKHSGRAFGSIESPVVAGTIPPPSSLTKRNQGRMRGIQGHHNSCYLDATLYSMFSFTTVFDSLLHRERNMNDLQEYDEVQQVLKEHIVNPLRNGGFVRADCVLKLRKLLDQLGSTSGLMNEEKDPEEFLNSLLHQVLKSDALLKLRTPNSRVEETNYYQIITEKDDTKKSQPVQKLLEQSFLFSDLKLAEVPSCLILQMPRFGKRYKMYDFIQPNLKLDITHILENVPRECSVCGKVSTFECKDCYPEKHELSSLSYCDECVKTFHNKRMSHKPKPIAVPRGFRQAHSALGSLPSETMDLFAVVCIATSHYVAFVKCGTGQDSEWCFFDSMADRKGETNGYNIPMVTPCPEAKEWLSKKDDDIVRASEQGELPANMKRLFGDAYMCLYQNLEMTMYK